MIIGALIGAVLGAGIGIGLFVLIKHLKPSKKVIINVDDKEKQEKLRKDFDELMKYDYTIAIRRGDR